MQLNISDNSGDKDFFTIIPNYIANHSTANDQALYLQMKKHAGENGQCYVSEKTLLMKLGIGRTALKKSITYLLNKNWISYIGQKKIKTMGGNQYIKNYKINNIWKINTNHYRKGVSETAPLNIKGVSENTQRGVQNDIKGVSETAPKKIVFNNINKEEEKINYKNIYLIKKLKKDLIKKNII